MTDTCPTFTLVSNLLFTEVYKRHQKQHTQNIQKTSIRLHASSMKLHRTNNYDDREAEQRQCEESNFVYVKLWMGWTHDNTDACCHSLN